MCRQVLMILFVGALLQVPTASAALIFEIEPASVLPGETALIDVFVESDAAGGDLLASFTLDFRITPDAGTTSSLKFKTPASSQPNPATDLSYVFFGDSLIAPGPFGSISTTVLPDDTYVVGDATASFSDIVVTAKKLAARLEVVHDFGAAAPSTTLGHTFTVSLGPATSAFDSGFSPVDFTTSSGTVTVTPEPASFIIWSLFATGAIWLGRQQCRRKASMA